MMRVLSPHATFRRVQLDVGACWPDAADAGGNLIRDADEGSGRMQGRMLDADTLCRGPKTGPFFLHFQGDAAEKSRKNPNGNK